MENDLAALTEQVRAQVVALGFDLADLRQGGTPRRRRLEVRIEDADPASNHGITIDDCVRVSRVLEAWLDRTGVLGANYVLEVSSPGIERPIRWRRHWQRFVGREVNLRLQGRGRCRATIVGVVEGQDAVVLRLQGDLQDITVPLDQVRDATLAVDWTEIG
jgi:ribosome maturation factor RimP